MRIRMALVATVALLVTVPAEAARDVFVRESPESAVATCLRPAGAPGLVGLLGPLERRMSPYDLLRVTPEGAAVVATARLGVMDVCPAVAADASGHAIVAGAVRREGHGSLIRATLAEPGAGFEAPVAIARARSFPQEVVVAISPRGDAVVAWVLTRAVRSGRAVRTRVAAALRPAGGEFGRPRFLTAWRHAGFLSSARVSAGMDAAGAATVAWSEPVPDRGDISSLHRLAVAAARPGEGFGPPQVLAVPVQDTKRVALAVAQDGRALLAHDGGDAIQVFERSPGSSGFERVRRWRGGRTGSERPEVALAPDGSAVLAWRGNAAAGNEDVFVASRSGTGEWTAPLIAQRSRERETSGEVISFVTYVSSEPSPPFDSEGPSLRVALSDGGRYLVSWAQMRGAPLGDMLLEGRILLGQAGGTPSPAEPAGCPCRPVEGLVPLELSGGDPVLTYTDNVTRMLGLGVELPVESGRLHLATPGRPPAGPSPPRVTIRPPPAARLGYERPLRVRLGCDRPCDIRAYVVGGDARARGLGTATLRRAGSTRVAIRPQFQRHLAPPRGGRARILVHGYAPNGRLSARRSVPVRLTRKRVTPLPRLLNVRAVRRGSSVVVTWETDRPAQGVIFEVTAQLSRRAENRFRSATREGQGRRRFRARLRGAFESVELSVTRGRPPYDSRTRIVPVAG